MATGPANPNNNQTNQNLQDNIDSIVDLQFELGHTTDLVKRMNEVFGDTSAHLIQSMTISTKINGFLKTAIDLQGKLGQEYIKEKNITSFTQKIVAEIANIKARISRLNGPLITDQTDLVKLEQQALQTAEYTEDTSDRALYLSIKQLRIAKETKQISDLQLTQLEEYNKEYAKLQGKLGVIGAIMKGIAKIPILGKLINAKDIIKDMEEEAGSATSTRWSVFRTGIKSLGGEMGRLFTDPLTSVLAFGTAFGEILKLAFKLDSEITNVANNMGVSKESARVLVDHFNKIQISTNDSFMNLTNQFEALKNLQTTLQTNALFSDQQLKDQINLTKKMGLTNEEAAVTQKFSLLTGRAANDILQLTIKINTTAASYKKILKEVSEISGDILARYKNNPELIAKAVVEANKLGVSLEQTRKISDSLLDFESSISNELEAELLTGRRLNLEKARALALDGDSVAAAKDIVAQFGSLESLMKLNVIQRKSIAATIGMSSDELINMVKEQRILSQLGAQDKEELQKRYEAISNAVDKEKFLADVRAKSNGDMLASQIQQTSTQQKFEESMIKLKDIIAGTLSGPLLGMIEGMGKLLEHTTTLKVVLGAVAAIMTAMATRAIVMAIATSIATGGVTGIAGILSTVGGLALGGIGAGIALNQGGDIPQHAAGGIVTKAHVGMVGEAGPEAIIPLSKQNAFHIEGIDKLIEQNNTLIDTNKSMIALMQKGGTVNLDSSKVGTTQGMSYTSYA